VSLRGAKRVVLLENPSTQATLEIIADRQVSSLAFIGHGSLGSFRSWSSGSEQLGWLSWYHMPTVLNHLKTGHVEQRTCVGLNAYGQISVPLGTFIVADQTKITAPRPGSLVSNCFGFEGFNNLLSPPFSAAHNSVEDLVRQSGQYLPSTLL
jgi:hypothetical protein